jgi:uncharacterized membrane protein YgdD (TMEM256/DUF423 family)
LAQVERDNAGTMNTSLPYRIVAAIGAVSCAIAVGLGAYASHGVDGLAQSRLQTASLYLFLHGLALAVFALRHRGRLFASAFVCWIVGCLAFCGSLVAAALWQASTTTAPIGGVAFMFGWLLLGTAFLKEK